MACVLRYRCHLLARVACGAVAGGKSVCLALGSWVHSLPSSLLSGPAHVSVLHNLSEGHSMSIYHNNVSAALDLP